MIEYQLNKMMKIGIDVYSFDKPGNNYGVGPGAYVWNILPEIIA